MKSIVLICSSLLILCTAWGQEKEKERAPWKDKIVIGGDVILSFSTNATQVGLSPLIGYRLSERLVSGVGMTYIYGSFRDYESHLRGLRQFNRFSVTDELFLHAEFEQSSYIFKFPLERESIRYEFPAILVGGGYRSSLGGRSGISITVLYDILQDRNSLYNGPIFRGGFMFGI
jgi:hypothetical protein